MREDKSEMSVYYDKEEGIWKCRSCSWTYQSGSQWTEHIEHSKWYLHMLINSKTINRQEPCFYCEIPGSGSNRYVRHNHVAENNHLQLDTSYQIDSSAFSKEFQLKDQKGYLVNKFSGKTPLHTEDHNIFEIPQDGLNIQDNSSKESLTFENSRLEEKLNGTTPTETADTRYYSGASLTVTIETKRNTYFQDPDRDNLNISIKDPVFFPGKQFEVTDESKQTPATFGAGTDTLISIEELSEPRATQEPQGLTWAETCPSPHSERVEYERFQGISIVKSIVYGGLAEFIASLGIVSSAVGADTVTLKILALGLANLIGGLFIISQKLWDLKSEHPSNPTDRITENNSPQLITQQDRYQELLGRRKNFRAHATIALLSFLIFGMIPPVIYAFSFRVSDNKDYKLIAVAAASIVCILILSTGKAYIHRPPKAYLKTVSFYVIMVFMASGVSFAFGDLFKKLLRNLGWISSELDLNFTVLETSI